MSPYALLLLLGLGACLTEARGRPYSYYPAPGYFLGYDDYDDFYYQPRPRYGGNGNNNGNCRGNCKNNVSGNYNGNKNHRGTDNGNNNGNCHGNCFNNRNGNANGNLNRHSSGNGNNNGNCVGNCYHNQLGNKNGNGNVGTSGNGNNSGNCKGNCFHLKGGNGKGNNRHGGGSANCVGNCIADPPNLYVDLDSLPSGYQSGNRMCTDSAGMRFYIHPDTNCNGIYQYGRDGGVKKFSCGRNSVFDLSLCACNNWYFVDYKGTCKSNTK